MIIMSKYKVIDRTKDFKIPTTNKIELEPSVVPFNNLVASYVSSYNNSK